MKCPRLMWSGCVSATSKQVPIRTIEQFKAERQKSFRGAVGLRCLSDQTLLPGSTNIIPNVRIGTVSDKSFRTDNLRPIIALRGIHFSGKLWIKSTRALSPSFLIEILLLLLLSFKKKGFFVSTVNRKTGQRWEKRKEEQSPRRQKSWLIKSPDRRKNWNSWQLRNKNLAQIYSATGLRTPLHGQYQYCIWCCYVEIVERR